MKTVIVLGMHGVPPSDFPRDEMAEFFGGQTHDHSSHEGGEHNEQAHGGHDHAGHEHGTNGNSSNGNGSGHATHATQEDAAARAKQLRRQRRAEIGLKMRAWPRTPENDPFFSGSEELAAHLAQASDCEVVVGFNEFCDPTVDTALNEAVALGAEKIVVITPMMTRGGEHSEADIPGAMKRAQALHPHVEMVYAWPFDVSAVARFLATQVRRFAEQPVEQR